MKHKANLEMAKHAGHAKKPLLNVLADLKPVKYLQTKINEPFVLSSLFDFKKRLLSVLLISGPLILSIV
jgi:hypothetical protein